MEMAQVLAIVIRCDIANRGAGAGVLATYVGRSGLYRAVAVLYRFVWLGYSQTNICP